MMQGWYDLAFLHWPLNVSRLRALVPQPLSIDTFEGRAWLGITPFDVRLRPRGLPVVAHFAELNCRTYVSFGGKPGVYFFSLDATSRMAVFGARAFFLLPYFHARMSMRNESELFSYCSLRSDGKASFAAEYQAAGPVRRSMPGTLEHWLTERYCLYTHAGRRILRSEIHHEPWPLQDGACAIASNSVASSLGIELPETRPLCHFARELDVLVWPLRSAD
jgi:uncharacterized protein YqjF (DUF2071 family)